MEVTTVYITNIPVIITGDIKIQIAEVTAEETKKEEFSDDESFNIECDMQEETIPRAGIHEPPGPGTDRSELVRDLEIFLGPGPVPGFEIFLGPGSVRSEI